MKLERAWPFLLVAVALGALGLGRVTTRPSEDIPVGALVHLRDGRGEPNGAIVRGRRQQGGAWVYDVEIVSAFQGPQNRLTVQEGDIESWSPVIA